MPLTPSSDLVAPYACSVVGKVRDHNEDSVLAKQWLFGQSGPLGLQVLLAVADGMGGHHNGEWASAAALETLQSSLETAAPEANLRAALISAAKEANRVIYAGSDREGVEHPGTTLTAAAVKLQKCEIVHVGDSRLYLIRSGEMTRVTSDDSWAQELINKGDMTEEQAEKWAYRNQLTKAVGTAAEVEPSTYTIDLVSDDILILCSDGLTGMISEEAILQVVTKSESPMQAGEALCAAANAAGGEDNISAVVYCHGKWNPAADGVPRVRKSTAATGRTENRVAPSGFGKIGNHRWLVAAAALLVALLLAAGIKLLLSPSAQPAKQKTSAVQQGPKQELSRLVVRIGEKTGADKSIKVLRLLADGLSFVPIEKTSAWQKCKDKIKNAIGDYSFNKAQESIDMLSSGKARLVLVCPDGSRAQLEKSPGASGDEWTASITAPGSYDLVFQRDGSSDIVMARFKTGSETPERGGQRLE